MTSSERRRELRWASPPGRLPRAGRDVRPHLLGLVAPAITEQTAGCAARPPIATSSRLSPCSAAKPASASIRSQRSSETSGRPAQPRALGRRLAAAVLAGQEAAREREVRDQPDPELARRPGAARSRPRARARSTRSGRRRSVRARARPRRVRLADLRGREVRGADVAHLPSRHELVQRAQGLLDRRDPVRPVVLVEVDVVGAEPLQRGLDRAADVAGCAARARCRRVPSPSRTWSRSRRGRAARRARGRGTPRSAHRRSSRRCRRA